VRCGVDCNAGIDVEPSPTGLALRTRPRASKGYGPVFGVRHRRGRNTMRLWIALSLSLALAGAAHAAEIKGTSRIDAATVCPAGAESVRIARVKMERGEHTLLFADLPAETIAASIRVEGKATGKLEIGSVDTRTLSVPRGDDVEATSERRKVEEAIEQL